MKSYRRRLYKFAGNIDDEKDDNIIAPEYRNVSDTTYDVMRPVLLNQRAMRYISNKTVEDERDKSYAYSQPVVKGFAAVRPTPEREKTFLNQIEEQAIAENNARYMASLPRYMITDKPGLDRPFIGLEDVLLLGGKTLLEKTGRSLYNLAAHKTTGKGVTKSAVGKTGKVKVNKKDVPEYNYNIARYPVLKNREDSIENATSFLYYHPQNRLQIDIETLKKRGWKMDGEKLLPKTVNQKIDNNLNILIKDLDAEYKRAINWNKSPYRTWNDEANRQLYLNNLENVRKNATINITDLSKIEAQGYYSPNTHNIFLHYQGKPQLLRAYYHEFGGHAADMFDPIHPIKSELLQDSRFQYWNFISKGAKQHLLDSNKGKMEIVLRKDIDELMKSYKNKTLKDPKLIKKAKDLNDYKLKPAEIVARVEELRRGLLINKIKLNGKQFKPSTIIGNKEFSELSELKGYIAGKKIPILQGYHLDMFTPETIKNLMNKIPTVTGIGTAGLAGYGLTKE